MANEATLRVSLQITGTANSLKYQSNPTSFSASISSTRGPSPGLLNVLAVPNPATIIDLSKLTTPGLGDIHNLSTQYTVQFGLSDGTKFRPMFDIGPGEIYPFRVSAHLGKDENAGTGSTSPPERLALRASGGACDVVVNVFDS